MLYGRPTFYIIMMPDLRLYIGGSSLTWTFFPPEDVGTRKITLLWTVCGNTALTAWQVAMLPASAH
jgi:hypothetical protein